MPTRVHPAGRSARTTTPSSSPNTGTMNIHAVSEPSAQRWVSTNQASDAAAVAIRPRKASTPMNRGVQSMAGAPWVNMAMTASAAPPIRK